MLSHGVGEECDEVAAFLHPWLKEIKQRVTVLVLYEKTKKDYSMHLRSHRGVQTCSTATLSPDKSCSARGGHRDVAPSAQISLNPSGGEGFASQHRQCVHAFSLSLLRCGVAAHDRCHANSVHISWIFDKAACRECTLHDTDLLPSTPMKRIVRVWNATRTVRTHTRTTAPFMGHGNVQEAACRSRCPWDS